MTRIAGLAAVALAPALCLAAAVVPAGRPTAATASVAACSPGVVRLEGEDVRVFCGPATAKITFSGRTYRFRNGLCERTRGSGLGQFAVNIGIQELPPPSPPAAPKFSHFGVALERARGGTYRNQAVGIVVAGKRNLSPLVNTVTVPAGLRTGSFRGTTDILVPGKLPKRARIAGSWSCGRGQR